jgi:hypothetical protein
MHRDGVEKLLPQDTTYASRRCEETFASSRRLGMEKLLPQDATYASRRKRMLRDGNVCFATETYASRRKRMLRDGVKKRMLRDGLESSGCRPRRRDGRLRCWKLASLRGLESRSAQSIAKIGFLHDW